MPITHISLKGRKWPIEKFVAACLSGEADYPSQVAATILENHKEYDNRGTISGSQLHKECDYSSMLERLPYTQEISNMFWATFRGANVHAMIEKCRDKPEFKNWIFEERFFAVLRPDDTIEKLEVPRFGYGHDVPLKKKGAKDWRGFKILCDKLIADGIIILSGQVDSYDKSLKVLDDLKTAKSVGDWTNVKQSWQQQMNQYCLVLHLNGHEVRRVRITVMDATLPVVLEAAVPNLEVWAGEYLVPRARYLAWLQGFTAEEIQAINDGKIQPPENYPKPNPNHLCSGQNREGKIYCPFRENLREDGSPMCPAWRGDEDLTAQLEASLKKPRKAKT